MAEVVALAHPVWQAGLARSLVTAFAGSGWNLLVRKHSELAAEVDVEQTGDSPPQVYPDRPLLWLSTADPAGGDSSDERFLAAEAAAASRTIATLTRSPVLNRPSPTSATGRLPVSSAMAVRRARALLPDGAVRGEHFDSLLPEQAGGGTWEIYDYSTGRSHYRLAAGTGPFRHRRSLGEARLVQVRLVGDRVISATRVPDATIAASRRVAAAYQLDLATVSWLVGSRETLLAKVDGSSWDGGLGAIADEVAAALVGWLSDRTAAGRNGGPR